MKVVISAGGRFHALHLAKQLNKKGLLEKLFTFDYQKKDTSFIPASKVNSITSCKIMNDWFLTLRLAKFFDKTKFNGFKDNVFDNRVYKELSHMSTIDIFVGWAHYAKKSIHAARKAGATIIIESGSCHIKTQQKILEAEYSKWGVQHPPIRQETIDKMCDEYAMADYIMTLSSFARQSFLDYGFKEDKILTIPCGIDVEYFEHPSIHPSLTGTQDERDADKHPHSNINKPNPERNELSMDQTATNTAHPEGFAQQNVSKDSTFRVIFVGLITLRKGLQYLIQAWNQAKLPKQEAELIIVGAMQKDFAQIMPQLPMSDNIRFIGSTSRQTLRSLYAESSLFVLPSLEDGFGMVIGEAMASGLPVICTTNTGAPDIFSDGECGFLTKPGNALQLAEKITWCYQHRNEAQAMGQRGQKRIKQFSWDQYGANIYETYTRIRKEKKHG